MKNIVLIGYSGVGKTTLADYIVKKYNFKKIEIGDIVKKCKTESDYEGFPLQYANYIFKKYDYNYFVKIALAQHELISEPIVIVGPRTMKELNYILQIFKNNILTVGICSKKYNRYKRYKKIDNSAIKVRDKIESSWGLDELIKNCDILIDNNDTLEQLYNKIIFDIIKKL